MKRNLVIITLLAAATLVLLPSALNLKSNAVTMQGAATTFTVNSTADSADASPGNGVCADANGACTLRAAIQEVNNLDGATGTIRFAIPGAGAHTITLANSLPDLLNPVVIDGTTQPGYAGSPLVEVFGGQLGAENAGFILQASNSTIRGLAINGFSADAIIISGSNNAIRSNFLGVAPDGVTPRGNGGAGVFITSPFLFAPTAVNGSGNTIGGAGAGNLIANNGSGVIVDSGTGNAILSNSIFNNTGLGIDLGLDGVTPNDTCDEDVGPNGFQNYPDLASANSSGGSTVIQGSLQKTPLGGPYTLQFFSNQACDGSGFGEGQTFIGSAVVGADTSCGTSFTVTLPVGVAGGQAITATATDSANNTSEFSRCIQATGPVCTLNCPNIIRPNTPGQCGAVVTFTPGSGGCGTVTCSPASGSFFPVGTTTVTCGIANQSCTFTVTVFDAQPPTINCPPPIFVTAPATACSAVVNFATPTATDNCNPVASDAPDFGAAAVGPVTCTPPSGSQFPVGGTLVTCTATDSAGNVGSCSFSVFVRDVTPPAITCPADVVATVQNQTSAVVNFPAPTATDNCAADLRTQCSPASGSAFPIGTSTVICRAIDASENISSCSFAVTVRDTFLPTINCPANVTATIAAPGCSGAVSYPPPTLSGNTAGVTVACTPPSGSTFPIGATTVNCAATTASGNRATCSFTVTVQARLQLTITFNGSSTTPLQLGPADPPRKPKSSPPASCPCSGTFSVTNNGCGPVELSLQSILRNGGDVTSGRITDPDDSRFFIVTLTDTAGVQTCGANNLCVRLNPGQRVGYRVTFRPFIPALSGRTSRLSASEVLPEEVTATIKFTTSLGQPFEVPVVGRVTNNVHLINPNNVRKRATVDFTRGGDELRLTYAVFDSNAVSDAGRGAMRAKYEFLSAGGQVVSSFDVDLSQSIIQSGIINGQSFIVEQRFSGASNAGNIASVRVTVTDGQSSDSVTAPLAPSAAQATAAQEGVVRPAVLLVPKLRWVDQ